jgi:hypothetical protein
MTPPSSDSGSPQARRSQRRSIDGQRVLPFREYGAVTSRMYQPHESGNLIEIVAASDQPLPRYHAKFSSPHETPTASTWVPGEVEQTSGHSEPSDRRLSKCEERAAIASCFS